MRKLSLALAALILTPVFFLAVLLADKTTGDWGVSSDKPDDEIWGITGNTGQTVTITIRVSQGYPCVTVRAWGPNGTVIDINGDDSGDDGEACYGATFTKTIQNATSVKVSRQTASGDSCGDYDVIPSGAGSTNLSTWSISATQPATVWSGSRQKVHFTVRVDESQPDVKVEVWDGGTLVVDGTVSSTISFTRSEFCTTIKILPLTQAATGDFQYAFKAPGSIGQ